MPLTVLLVAMAWLGATVLLPSVAAAPQEVWLDVDTSTGITDVDDGLAMIQAFHSPELSIRGVSTVYGNASLEDATSIANQIVKKFGPRQWPIHTGATAAAELGQDNEAVRAMAAALADSPLTILALGPVTNVATVVKLHPELQKDIERVVIVAARRPGQRFVSSDWQRVPHRDFNFENDPEGMRILLESDVELVFAPWEVSSHVWIDRDDLDALRSSGPTGAWIAETSQYWIELWERSISKQGFNPFDTLAVGYLTHPELIKAETMSATIEEAEDDRDPRRRKPYLLVRDAHPRGRQVTYCYQPLPAFKEVLLERLARPGKAGKAGAEQKANGAE